MFNAMKVGYKNYRKHKKLQNVVQKNYVDFLQCFQTSIYFQDIKCFKMVV